MGRPTKNNCEYYPHKNNMRNHRKIKALRNKFGSVNGYAFWAMFIEYLTELDGNVFEYSELECELFAAELGVSVTVIKEMIDFCIKIELLFVRDGFVHSHSLDEYLGPVYEKRRSAKKMSATQERRQDGKFSNKAEEAVVSVTDIHRNSVDSGDIEEESPRIGSNIIELNRIKDNLPLEKRKKIFFEKIISEFGEKYSKTKIESFCNYWTEHNENGRKMKFEKHKTFNISQRLLQWKDFSSNGNGSHNGKHNGAASKENSKLENIDYLKDNQ